MFLTFLYLTAVGVMIYFAVRKGIDRSIIYHKVSAILFWIALTILTLYGAFFLAFGIGEIGGGDISGAMHLAPAILIYLLVFLCWRRPFEGGITLLVSSVISGLGLISSIRSISIGNFFSSLILFLPTLSAGMLFLVAWLIANRSKEI